MTDAEFKNFVEFPTNPMVQLYLKVINVKISTKGRYALRLMLDLAENGSKAYIPLKDISERQEITIKYLEQIVSQLSRAGLIKSTRGNNGGYRLVKPACCYSVGEILRAAEGNLAPVACIEVFPNQCSRCKDCLTLPLWEKLGKTINDFVDGVTLEDLLKGNV